MINPTEAPKSLRQETKKHRRNMRAIGAGVVVAAAGAGLLVKSHTHEDKPKQPVAEVREALEHTPDVMQGVVVLSEGTNLRSEPRINNGDPAVNNDGNVTKTISLNKAVVINRPVVIIGNDNRMWIGFALRNGEKTDPNGTDTSKFVFAAYEALSEQGKALFRQVDTPDSVHPFTQEIDGVNYLLSSDDGPVAVGLEVDADLVDAGVAYAATQIQMPEILESKS